MRRRILFVTTLVVSLVAGLATGADRPAETAFHGAKRPPSAPSKGQGLAAYAKLPLAFTTNAGQHDRRVRFASQASGSSLFFTRTGIVLSFAKGKRGVALRLAFRGANPEPAIVGARPGPGRVNYLLGNDPARWHTNLPTYGEIVYRRLWPGVDLPSAARRKAQIRVPARTGGRALAGSGSPTAARSGSRSAEAASSGSRPRSAAFATLARSATRRSETGGSPSRAGSCSGGAAPTASPSEASTTATRSSSIPASSTPHTWAGAVTITEKSPLTVRTTPTSWAPRLRWTSPRRQAHTTRRTTAATTRS